MTTRHDKPIPRGGWVKWVVIVGVGMLLAIAFIHGPATPGGCNAPPYCQ